MEEKVFKRWLLWISISFLSVTTGISIMVYTLTQDIKIAVLVLGGLGILCFLAYLLHKIEDSYISSIAIQLSNLIDILVELEEKEIFPENEDTILSKLQSKVIRLMKILKNQSERNRQEHENIKTLVSDISHQLKAPISNLKMYGEFLADESVSEEQHKEYINIIQMSVKRLQFLSESMIKISRLEGGLIHLDMRKQSINETALKAIKDIYPKAKQKGVVIEYEEQSQIQLYHDRNWSAEAIFNLLDNAVKYGQKGNKIKLTIKRLGMFVEVSVEDENGSIPRTEQNKIFKRFYRGSNSTLQEGIGIGLYLSSKIAIKQGGYVKLKTTKYSNIFSILFYIKKNSSF